MSERILKQMPSNENPHSAVTAFWAVNFATFGIVAASILLALLGAGPAIVQGISGAIIVAVVALYVAAAFFGAVAGLLIIRFKNRLWIIRLTGMSVAWFSLLMSCLAGSSR